MADKKLMVLEEQYFNSSARRLMFWDPNQLINEQTILWWRAHSFLLEIVHYSTADQKKLICCVSRGDLNNMICVVFTHINCSGPSAFLKKIVFNINYTDVSMSPCGC